ncbi:hypothetical protein B0H67DRAFT_640316 [Lasiosphaeris hirsuta]|uniref:Uncharacterized protein n=1 Tax=Lasiosphaeris hirsuta TaxID=260670 RepID=A0AA40E8C2_9PEZI|nr:hypothetical protein B0H67DRAFT_640316 [Lasiosphaeris hirsuta]
MPALSRITSPRSRAFALRSFTSISRYLPFRASAVEVPRIWRNIPREEPRLDAVGLDFPTTLGDQYKRFLYWRWSWDAPDVVIEDQTPRSISRESRDVPADSILAVSGEVKGNPTESEADVWADRTDDDPLPPELHHTIQLPAGDAVPGPTDSEQEVQADRSEEDPLPRKKGK